ncbi:hypothetical protein [Sulfurospirillum arcachonense]|uniref:hypothetical protein n=1 Tax=Sulfurospirillum arcachonense TaxID=57666 RepID=UPI00046A0BAC|nr:hypothetical protein [Sulfurospirillum arcachonense]
MQIDKDLNSNTAELYLKVRSFIIKNIEKYNTKVTEKYSQNITSIFSKEFNNGFCYIKTKDNTVHIGWFKGSSIEDIPQLLLGKGKYLRGQKIIKLDKIQKDAIKYYIQQTQILLLEQQEKKKLKSMLK